MRPEPEDPTPGEEAIRRRIERDPLLAPYETALGRRQDRVRALGAQLAGDDGDLLDFASGHERFGLHRRGSEWVLREWAPSARSLHLKGSFSDWRTRPDLAFVPLGEDGVWELRLPAGALAHRDVYRLEIRGPDGGGDRIPAWCRRVVRDEDSGSFNAQVWHPPVPHAWRHEPPRRRGPPLLLYEAHVGMAQEAARVGTYDEFRVHVLPRIRDAGYEAIQLMALAEHPYYASFGYQVTSFFACSSRFGTPEALKALVDAAHGMGLRVLMDLVHSHAARNEVEGISHQDGTSDLYFHPGPRGVHPAWDSRCFDYGKVEVLRFLLSNCRFWLEEYRLDGFRFDGVTSMLYRHHGLAQEFTDYEEYFSEDVDEEALDYLALANDVIHRVTPDAVTIAEDVSGFPGLALPLAEGGAGFDLRFAMGVPDHWTRLTKDVRDEDWSLQRLWYELTNRRRDEATISYVESHDQALVGNQTLIFRLVGARMYDRMLTTSEDPVVERGIALHKLIRLATLGSAGHGYLSFMGNEFGHPDWIDFPRAGNGWSHAHARRQWGLAEEATLRFRHLAAFDRDLLTLAKAFSVPDGEDEYLLHQDEETKVLAWLRGPLVFVLNFHPDRSYTDYRVPAAPGTWHVVLDTDRGAYGGFDRQDPDVAHTTRPDRIERHDLALYLPARTGLVLAAAVEAGR